MQSLLKMYLESRVSLVLRQDVLHEVCGVTGQELSVWQGGNQSFIIIQAIGS